MPEEPTNALGLDFSELSVEDKAKIPEQEPEIPDAVSSPQTAPDAPKKEKTPYYNPERVKTGGAQRVL